MDYSKTVNLPKTSFSMKADLANREPIFQKLWEDKRIYEKLLERDAPMGDFILHDGPPYSNGDIHIGHALNKLLKDFIVRYKAMKSYRAPYIPGWDNHGLPIEQKVADEFRKKHVVPTKLEMRKACREYAAKWVDKQREQFKRLGGVGEWENPYLTMDYDYEATIVKVFGELAKQGYVYRGLKPIHWCINDETALAEAEIEYADHKSPSIYVRFPLVTDPKGLFGSDKKNYTMIWTTTPWTIPANLAVAVHPDYEYAFVDVDGNRYLIAAELVGKTMTALGEENYCVVKTIKGGELEGVVFRHPIYDRNSVLVHASYVTLEDGTGVVHTAPGHGREDFETGQRYGLDVLNPVDERGFFTKDAGQFEGLHILKQGNQAVLDVLKENGSLLASSEIAHSYPHCWRCHKPVVFRTTVQWFMSIDHNDLRRKMLDEIEKIDFYPAEARNRLTAMIENSPDWCLSRQRSWGVGVPVFFCKKCDEAIMTEETINAVYQDALANGSDSWFDKSPEEILPAGYKCPKCGGMEFCKETDVLDVWFDSGSSFKAVVENRLGTYPADMYLEGSDQHRGWFNKSLVVGTATKGGSPFRQLVSHGFTLDSEGKAMSKSIGNTIAPQNIIKNVGADVLRLFFSSTDYFEDVRIGEEILTRVTDAYRRIRNTFRFILGNISDFDPAVDAVSYDDLEELDRYALHRLQELVRQVGGAYEVYEFHKVYQAVHNYCAVDLSSLYLDILKDRLYASARDSKERRSAQTALYHILSALTRMLAPVLAHTAEEVWQALRQCSGQAMPGEGREESVMLARFPEVVEAWMDARLAQRWAKIFEARDKVLMALEDARQSGKIGKPMESRVKLSASGAEYDLLSEYEAALPSILIVSQVELAKGDGELSVEVEPPAGAKCDRCWLVLESVGSHEDHPTLCDRCYGATS
ncbi:MAG: isoleucine--tRNA ligase [Armatimonadetes bacterium]|nr:isoleucine--tRNA ligase [Armatimonadota bacterium]